MLRRYAAGILAVFALAVLTVSADDFWVKKNWKDWTASDCKKLLEDSPWARRVMHENESNINHLPSAASQGNGSQPTTAAASQSNGAGEINYIVQDRSAAPIRQALIRQQQITKGYDKMSDADKKAFDAQMDQMYGGHGDVITIHVKYYGNRDVLTSLLNNAWNSLPADTVPADMILITSSGAKIKPTTYVADASGGPEFDLTFPRAAVGDGLKSFKLQIPSPMLGDFAAAKIMVEFKVDKMTFEGKPAF
jgi:hypothetical protein